MKNETIAIPRWFLEHLEDTLRIQNNINEPEKKESGESCQDRNIRQSLNGIRKLLNGEELTGRERFEKLQASDVDKAAKKIAYDVCKKLPNGEEKDSIVYYAILAAGAGIRSQFPTLPDNIDKAANDYVGDKNIESLDLVDVPEVFKAGAMWLKGQGKTITATIGIATEKIVCEIKEETLDSLGLKAGDKVEIQIRKADENHAS